MDYLDPVKKRNHRIRLYIGYGLLTCAVAIATIILVYVGSGYFVDRKTGDLIQNGQLYLNSAPEGASIFLNGRQQRPRTAGRLVIPSGKYSVVLKRDGYRDWSADVSLDGGVVQRLDYARLIPKTLKSIPLQTFASSPYSITQSSDRNYLSLQFADKPLSIFIIDLTKADSEPKEIILAKTLFADPAKLGQIVLTEWADDSKHFIVKNVVDNIAKDYLVVNRDLPDQTINLTLQLHLDGLDFSMRDNAFDQYYAYDAAQKTLGTINLSDKILVPKLTDVTTFKTVGPNTILYVTSTAASTKTKMQVRLLSGDKNYLMREVPQSVTYLIAISKLNSQPVIAIGVASENKVTILRNPLAYLKTHPAQLLPQPTTVLQVESPTEVSFSTDATAVMARGGQHFAAHNFDEDKTARFDASVSLPATLLKWADGKHLIAVSGADSYLFDYDGANLQKMVPSIDGFGAYFDISYQAVFSFRVGSEGKPFDVTRASLRPALN